MPITPDLPFPKSAGDAIRSKDWNDLVTETQRLDNAKVNRSGDAISGSLTIAGALAVGTATAPSAKLHVIDSSTPAVLRIQSTQAFGSGQVEFWSDPLGSGTEWRPGLIKSIDAGGSTGGLAFLTNGSGAANRTGQVEAMRLVNGNVGIGTDNPQARLDVNGAIRAGNSDIYFTQTNHNHTGIGNATGFAAIENAVNFNGLMILGRSGSPNPMRPANPPLRVVKLWDFLDVNGEMRVTGAFLQVVGAGNEQCYIGGDGAGGDVQVGSMRTGIRNLSLYNSTDNVYMDLFCTALHQVSDLSLKTNVALLTDALDKVCALRGVRFDWKHEEVPQEPKTGLGRHLGLIAQEVAKVIPEAVSENRGAFSVSYMDIVPLLVEAIKELQVRIERLENTAVATPKPKSVPNTK